MTRAMVEFYGPRKSRCGDFPWQITSKFIVSFDRFEHVDRCKRRHRPNVRRKIDLGAKRERKCDARQETPALLGQQELVWAAGNGLGAFGGQLLVGIAHGLPEIRILVKQILDDILERLPDLFPMIEILERIDDVTPYTGVFLQEAERMNALIFEMRRSLIELDSGLKGDLSITEPMEKMMNSLASQKVPLNWEKLAWASRAGLGVWFADLLARQAQLLSWTGDLALPRVSWISGFFNPMAFLVPVMQVASRKNDWALNKLVTVVDVTKKATPEEIEAPARDDARTRPRAEPMTYDDNICYSRPATD